MELSVQQTRVACEAPADRGSWSGGGDGAVRVRENKGMVEGG